MGKKKEEIVAELETKVEKKKWFNESDGWGFEKDDVVYIGIEHPNGVADRFALVLEPSEKPNHIKAQMQNPKSGELQNSVVVINNAHLLLVAKGGLGSPVNMMNGDEFSISNMGIYKTRVQLEKENSKNKDSSEPTIEGDNDMAYAQ